MMKKLLFVLAGLGLAVPTSAAVITTHTCTCTMVPQNISADITSADYVEPPDDVQAAGLLEDLAHEPPFNPNFVAEQLVLRKIKECFDMTTEVSDVPGDKPEVVIHFTDTEPRTVDEAPLVAMILSAGALFIIRHQR